MDTQNNGAMHNDGSHGDAMHSAKSAAAGKNTLMGIFSYIGPLIIVSYLTAKDDPFVKFHIKQGLVLIVIEVAVWVLGVLFFPLFMLLRLINLFVLILAIVGIVNASQGKEKELPLVGNFGEKFKI